MAKKNALPMNQRIDMTNPEHVYGILFYCLESISDTMAAGLDKVLGKLESIPASKHDEYLEKAYEACSEKCIGFMMMLNSVFLGQAPEIAIYKDWDAAALGRSLRKEFAFQLMALPEEDQEEFQTDESIVSFALNLFMQEGQKIVLEPAGNDDEAEAQAKELHEFLIHWTELLMQKPFPQELKAERT